MNRYEQEFIGQEFLHYKGLRFAKLKLIPTPTTAQNSGVVKALHDAYKNVQYHRAMNKEPPEYYAMPGGSPLTKDTLMKTVDHWEDIGLIDSAGMYGLLEDE